MTPVTRRAKKGQIKAENSTHCSASNVQLCRTQGQLGPDRGQSLVGFPHEMISGKVALIRNVEERTIGQQTEERREERVKRQEEP